MEKFIPHEKLSKKRSARNHRHGGGKFRRLPVIFYLFLAFQSQGVNFCAV